MVSLKRLRRGSSHTPPRNWRILHLERLKEPSAQRYSVAGGAIFLYPDFERVIQEALIFNEDQLRLMQSRSRPGTYWI